MKKSIVIIIAVVAIVLIVLVPGCSTYNSLVELKNSKDQAWSEVQNQYQRRSDLIPNLVATVKGYAQHESTTLQGVTNARAGIAPIDTTQVMQAARAVENAADANAYASALSDLKNKFSIYVNAVHEAYPDLKANENFLNLQAQLEGTENRVELARNKYTQAVMNYNNKVQKFPSNIIAKFGNFPVAEQFQATEEAQTAPKVEF